jgi:hypothetical protein
MREVYGPRRSRATPSADKTFPCSSAEEQAYLSTGWLRSLLPKCAAKAWREEEAQVSLSS